MLSSASALTSCSMRSGNWHYVVEELLLRDRERLEDVHGEDTLEKSENLIIAAFDEFFLSRTSFFNKIVKLQKVILQNSLKTD